MSTTTSYTSDELRRIVAKAEITHLQRQILALQHLRGAQHYAPHDVAGSTTIVSEPIFGRKLNHTYGLGVFGSVTAEDLREIELAYERSGPACRPELDMCEFADKTAFDLLAANNYLVTGSICQFQCYLSNFVPSTTADDVVAVFQTPDDDHERFIKASMEGFRSTGRNEETLRALVDSAIARSDTSLFSATFKDDLVGTAAMATIDVGGRKVALLFMDSCLEHARGKGVHRALLLERAKVAKMAGCEMAIASARNGSGSARNIVRAGLAKLYLCETYSKVDGNI